MKTYNGKTIEELAKLARGSFVYGTDRAPWGDLSDDEQEEWLNLTQAVAEACAPGWVSILDGTPEPGSKIWFRTNKYAVVAGTVTQDEGILFIQPEHKRDSFSFKVLGVTHWMPAIDLPPAPEVGR